MAPPRNERIPPVDRSKLPRPSFGASMIKKSGTAAKTTGTQQPAVSTKKAQVISQAVLKNEIQCGNRKSIQPKSSLIPSNQPRKSILVNGNHVAPAKENVYAHNRAKLLEQSRRSGIMPPPRQPIAVPVGSNLRLHRPSFGGLSQRPPAGRPSIVEKQIASGPIAFEVDETATHSILTNRGIVDDAAARAGSLAAPRRPSMYASRRRQSMASAGTSGMEAATRALARRGQVNMALQADLGAAQAPTVEDVKVKTPGRLSMYRRQSTSKYFGTNTPVSTRKERPRNGDGFKMDYLKVPGTPGRPLPSFQLTEDRSSAMPPIQGSPAKAQATVETDVIKVPKDNVKRLIVPVSGRSPARPVRSVALSRYSRRTTMEFEQIYANFSPNRLENELEAVTKQKKAIEKLLESNATKLTTIVEGKERESIMPLLEEEEEESPSASTTSTHAIPKHEQPSTSGIGNPKQVALEVDEDGDSDDEVPAKIQARRNAQFEEHNEMSRAGEFGMRLRPRNNRK